MQPASTQSGVTFAVDDVTPATKPLPVCRTHEAVKEMLRGPIESCSDYHSTVVKGVHYQPLLAAVYTAFNEHRPLVLSPDAVWITIAQGVAQHMAVHGERLRSRFVAHAGKLDLVFRCSGWAEGSPENPWPEAFASWSGQIRDHVGAALHDALVCDFSTTGPVERAVSQIVLMDVFERYFRYVFVGICGIPAVTLEGAPADWDRLVEKVDGLAAFDLDWWLVHLRPVCEQFARASRGDVDLDHWRGICKLRSQYGGDVINGWVARLFPYLRAFVNGPCSRRNPIFETGEGFQTSVAPPGLSRVPFARVDEKAGRKRPMEAVGGLLGVSQDPETLALRPKPGWAVREAEKLDALLARLSGAEHAITRGAGLEELPRHVPPDLAKFYHQTDGAELFGRADSAACRIVPVRHFGRLDWGKVADFLRDCDTPNGHIWYRLAWLADGSWLAVNPQPARPPALRELARREPAHPRWHNLAAICHCHADTAGVPGKNPVVAHSFTELLERILDAGGRPYWLDPQFPGYGDAEEYTLRK